MVKNGTAVVSKRNIENHNRTTALERSVVNKLGIGLKLVTAPKLNGLFYDIYLLTLMCFKKISVFNVRLNELSYGPQREKTSLRTKF